MDLLLWILAMFVVLLVLVVVASRRRGLPARDEGYPTRRRPDAKGPGPNEGLPGGGLGGL